MVRGERRPAPAKICRPLSPGALHRDRLFDQLDRGNGTPVVWISGPAGSGKTTLLSSYVEAREIACLWYQVDGGDADLDTFFHYLGLAARHSPTCTEIPLPHPTAEHLPGIPEFSRRLFQDFYSRLEVPSVVVFDNLDEVPDEAPLHRAVVEGLSRLPEGVALFLSSRSAPPPAYARLRANRTMGLLGWDDLRLTLEEFGEIACRHGVAAQGAESLRHLHGRMRGWVAGLRLLLEAALTRDLPAEVLQEGTPEEVFEYFGGEVFDRASAEDQDFLLRTAVFPHLTSAMAGELTGHPKPDRLLRSLHRRNQFTERRASSPAAYQYHPLFRTFLLERASERFTEAAMAALQCSAAGILAREGEPEAAAHLLRQSGDWQGLAKLVCEHAPELVRQGRYRLLANWLEAIPQAVVEETPWLLYWRGTAHFPFCPTTARRHFEEAYARFRDYPGNHPGRFLAWSGVVDSVLFEMEDMAQVDVWVRRFEDLCEDTLGDADGEVGARVAASMYTALILRRPGHPKMPSWEEEAVQVARNSRDPDLGVRVLFQVIFWRAVFGRLEEARLLLESMRRSAEAGGASPLSRIMGRFVEAYLLGVTGQTTQSLLAMEGALKVADETGVQMMSLMLLGNGAQTAIQGGDLSTGRQLWRRMGAKLLLARRWEEAYYHHVEARLSWLEGACGSALTAIDRALEANASAGATVPRMECQIVKSQVLRQLGERDAALRMLDEVEHLATEEKVPSFVLDCRLARADHSFLEGRPEEGVAALRNALTYGAENGLPYPYPLRPGCLESLCLEALVRGIRTPYVRRLVREFHLVSPASWLEAWPWPVRVYTLGQFQVMVDDHPLPANGKAQQKPLALLRALIAMGGRQIGVAEVADVLWPDADGDRAHSAFSSTLLRLRRLLGGRGAVDVHDGRVTLNPRHCWVDLFAVEHLLKWIEAGDPSCGDLDELVSCATQVTTLYRGPFLAHDTDDPWTVPPRERTARRVLQMVEEVGLRLERARRLPEAIELYRRALQIEPLLEFFHRRIISCCHRRGLDAEALAAYARCRAVLKAGLGMLPSRATELLHRRVRRSLKGSDP